MAGVRTLLSSVRNKAGPRKPIDCMICMETGCQVCQDCQLSAERTFAHKQKKNTEEITRY